MKKNLIRAIAVICLCLCFMNADHRRAEASDTIGTLAVVLLIGSIISTAYDACTAITD